MTEKDPLGRLPIGLEGDNMPTHVDDVYVEEQKRLSLPQPKRGNNELLAQVRKDIDRAFAGKTDEEVRRLLKDQNAALFEKYPIKDLDTEDARDSEKATTDIRDLVKGPAAELLKKSPFSPRAATTESSADERAETEPDTVDAMFKGFAAAIEPYDPESAKAARYREIAAGLRGEGPEHLEALEDAILEIEEMRANRFVSPEKLEALGKFASALQGEYETATGMPYDLGAIERIGKKIGGTFRSLLRPPVIRGHAAPAINIPASLRATEAGKFTSAAVSAPGSIPAEASERSNKEHVTKQGDLSLGTENNGNLEVVREDPEQELSPDYRTLFDFNKQFIDHQVDTKEQFASWFTPEKEEDYKRYVRGMIRYVAEDRERLPGTVTADIVAAVLNNGAGAIIQQIQRVRGKPMMDVEEILKMPLSHFAREYLDIDVHDIDPDFDRHFRS